MGSPLPKVVSGWRGRGPGSRLAVSLHTWLLAHELDSVRVTAWSSSGTGRTLEIAKPCLCLSELAVTRGSASGTGLGRRPPPWGLGREGRLGCALRGCGSCREARVPHVAGLGAGPQLRRASVMRPWLFGARIIVRLSGLLAGDQGLTSRTSGLGGRLVPDSDRGRGRLPGCPAGCA